MRNHSPLFPESLKDRNALNISKMRVIPEAVTDENYERKFLPIFEKSKIVLSRNVSNKDDVL